MFYSIILAFVFRFCPYSLLCTELCIYSLISSHSLAPM